MPAVGVSPSGAIAYQIGGEYRENVLIWLDRSGTRLEELSPEASGANPSLSPDGRRLVVDASNALGNRDLWVTDLDRGATTRLTFANTGDFSAVWSPDGGRVAFRRDTKMYVKGADGSADETVLSGVIGRPTSWSADGSYLLYETPARTLFLLPLTGGQKPIAVGSRNGSSRYGQFSSDGRYIAYSSDESGRYEVYVQSLPPATGKWKVSLNGGDQPRWSRKSGEIFFVSPDQTMMAVDVRVGQTLSAGVPRKLFQTGPVLNNFSYDVSADGERFLISQRRGTIPDTPITVVLNWWVELEERQNQPRASP
jgi:Tol biopolymer transport system component